MRKEEEHGLEQARLLDLSQDAILVRDSEDRVVYWNRGAERAYGYTAAEALGQHVDALLRTELPGSMAQIREALERDGEWSGELSHARKDGRRITTLSRWVLDRRGEGGDRVLESNIDITRRKDAEEALRRSEAKMRAVFSSLAEGVVFLNTEGVVEEANEAIYRTFGHKREDFLDPATDPRHRIIRPDGSPFPEAEQPAIVALRTGKPVRDVELGVPTDAGMSFRLVNAQPVFDDVGRLLGAVASFFDITQQKVAEARLRAVIEHLPFGLIVADLSTRALHWNQRALEIYGYAEEDEGHKVVGRLASEYRLHELDGTSIPFERWPMPRLLRGEGYHGWEIVVEKKGSRWRRVLRYSGVAVVGTQPPIGLLAVEDVTEGKRMEEELRDSDRRKTEFLAVLSHELRNPLAPIQNALQILERSDPSGPRARRAREIASRQVLHLARLVDDLLDVTRIARGKIELQRRDVDVGRVARATGEDLRSQLQERGVAFDIDVPSGPVIVRADETRVAQIIANLLQNAAKFTPAGGRVTLSVSASEDRARVTVRDTGMGIAPELLDVIFEPFIQAKQTLARSEGGLGLGLALVKGLVTLHGGEVTAVSEGPGRGAEITATLPLSPRARERTKMEYDETTTPTAEHHRVLVVDDNQDAAETLADLVRMFGHDAEVAFDGPSALATARDYGPDIVFCDIGLPGMDGYAVAEELRRTSAGAPHLVAVSGYAQPEDVAKAKKAGFDVHLAKPASPADIERVLAAPIRRT